jgi:hypothetical protein
LRIVSTASLATSLVGQVADFLRLAKHIREPRRRPALQCGKHGLVQRDHGEIVDQRGGHDRSEQPVIVIRAGCE